MDIAKTLEWTTIIGATILLFAIGFMSIPVLYFIETPPDDPDITVQVTAKQWSWQFTYPDGSVSGNLVVQAGDSVKLEMTSDDVIHSFYVRDLGMKVDIFPARVREFWIQPEQPGEYWIQCAEFCGRSHALMRAKLIVEGAAV